MSRQWYVCTVTLLVLLAFRPSNAAKSADLIKLTNCLYIAAKYNDGDSFRVRCGTDEFNLRLYFVDAPETNPCSEQTGEQSKYFGVTRDEVMNAGARASDIVKEMLRTPFVVWTRWASAGGRGTRYFALVEMDDKSLVEVLVSQGLARAKGLFTTLPTGEKAGEYAKKLKMLERDAQQGKRGIWATSTVGLTPQVAVPLVGAWERISLKKAQGVFTESAAPAAFLIFSANGYFSQYNVPRKLDHGIS